MRCWRPLGVGQPRRRWLLRTGPAVGPGRARLTVRVGRAVDVPADQSTRTSDSRLQPSPTVPLRSPRRRRPSGEPPPLPHHLLTTGVGWLVASVVLVALSIVVFAGGLRGPAVAVTVLDDAVVGWLAGLDGPWLMRTWEALAFLGSWWVLNTLGLGLVLALLALRRFRHLILALIAAQLLTTVT